jgi:hypothetical protein
MNPELDFKKSLLKCLKSDIKEILSDTVEASVDVLITNEVLKNIPFIEWGLKVTSTIDKIRTEFLIKKLRMFFVNTIDIDSKNYKNFVKGITKKDLNELHSLILITIDRINSEEKAALMGRIFSALVSNKISRSIFFRLANIIEALFIEDLKLFLEQKGALSHDKRRSNFDISQSYVTLGLYETHIVKSRNNTQKVDMDANLEFCYMISMLGQTFIEVCGNLKK